MHSNGVITRYTVHVADVSEQQVNAFSCGLREFVFILKNKTLRDTQTGHLFLLGLKLNRMSQRFPNCYVVEVGLWEVSLILCT